MKWQATVAIIKYKIKRKMHGIFSHMFGLSIHLYDIAIKESRRRRKNRRRQKCIHSTIKHNGHIIDQFNR